MVQDSYQGITLSALQNLYEQFISWVPNLLAALVVLILGWLLAIFLSKLVLKVLESVKIDSLANQLGLSSLAERIGRKLSLSGLGAWLVKWFFFLGSFVAAAEILGLNQVSSFLYEDVLNYAGNVVVAAAIFLLGLLAAKFFSGLVESVIKASQLHSAAAMATVTKWAIIVFTVIAVLSQLRIATDFLHDLFRAVIAMLAIAGGLAFGLGGQGAAKRWLDSLEEDLTKKM
ncbi:MAG: hypothetical protein HYZ51_01380 [Candidatus Doudnabacteria bacterium]|nr:hypothetical protein [Candidatus Doudnabacteria bacterium]